MKTISIYLLTFFVSFLISFASADSLHTGGNADYPYAWTAGVPATQLGENFQIDASFKLDRLPNNNEYFGIVGAWHGSKPERRRWSFALQGEDGKTYLVLALSGNSTAFNRVEISIEAGKGYTTGVWKQGSTINFSLNESVVGAVESSITPRESDGGISVGYHDTGYPDWSNTKGVLQGLIGFVSIRSNTVQVANWQFEGGSLADSTGNHAPLEARGTTFSPDFTVDGVVTGGGDGGGNTNPNPTIAELQAQVVALQGNLATTAAAKTAAEAQVSSLTATVAERDATIASLQNSGGNTAALQAQVAQLQADKASLQNQVVDLDAQVSSVAAARDSALAGKVSAETRVSTLENQFAAEKAARIAAEAAEGTAKSRVTQLESQINSKDSIIESKESIILSQKETIRILQESTNGQLVVNATADASVQNLRINRVSKDEVEVSGDINVNLWETGSFRDGYIISKPVQTVSFRIPLDRSKDTFFRVMVDAKG